MSWRTNRFFLILRSKGRTLGINKLIGKWNQRKGYEKRYEDGFSAEIRQKDCVWDVGANIGYYTTLFARKLVGDGHVFAFEPSPLNFKKLSKNCETLNNVRLLQIGLGADNTRLQFLQGADEIGASTRIIENSVADNSSLSVDIRTGCLLIDSGEVYPPNAIKIDVEGYELEVLQGMGDYLSSSDLRVIGIEIHFQLLKERGCEVTPRNIENLLMKHGFFVQWADTSHIIAIRKD
jgi:FkbM family methyltransferase